MLMRKCLLTMLILMLVILMLILVLLNLNTVYADTDADAIELWAVGTSEKSGKFLHAFSIQQATMFVYELTYDHKFVGNN